MSKIETVLLGYGKIGGLADKDGANPYKVTHAGAIYELEEFSLIGIVEPEKARRDKASERHGGNIVFSSLEQAREVINQATLIVDASPPKHRKANLVAVGNGKTFFIEKPTLLNMRELIGFDQSRIFVNYWRRFVPAFRSLANRITSGKFGVIQYARVCYGNGLLNNGSHMIDFAQMLLGDLGKVMWGKKVDHSVSYPIEGDFDVDFLVESKRGFPIFFKSLDFRLFRENSMTIVFEKGEIEILSESTVIRERGIKSHSTLYDCMEMDYKTKRSTRVDTSNYLLWAYSCIHKAITEKQLNYSGIESAISSERIVWAARKIAR
jgi:predicted dehydrogenase